MQSMKAHLPLIAMATVSALVIFYLYRELQKAKRALVPGSGLPEKCTTALCKDAKRVRFEDSVGSSDATEPFDLEPAAAPAAPAAAPAAAAPPHVAPTQGGAQQRSRPFTFDQAPQTAATAAAAAAKPRDPPGGAAATRV